MKVSVIVPVYNVYKYIDKCLNSLVNQTLNDIEIIVVNDGTKDDSQKIIDQYVKKYPNKVKSFIKDNGGQGSARNFGLLKACGEYIGYVDSDDYVETNMFLTLYNKAKETNADIVICNNYLVYEDGKRKIDKSYHDFADNKLNSFFDKKAVWNKIYKRDILLSNNIMFRSNKWYEDFDFTFNVLRLANKVEYVDIPLYNYLLRQGSTMNNKNINRNLELLESFNEILKCNLNEEEYAILEFLAIDHIYISSIVRIINIEINKDLINKLIMYMNNNFPNFKTNKYIYTLSFNRKLIYFLIKNKQYKIVKFIFKIKGGYR